MIQGEFVGSVGFEAVRFSEGQFGFAVETLDSARGMHPTGAEPVQQQRSMLEQGARHAPGGCQARACSLAAPAAQEAVGLGGRAALPELLEVLLEQVGPDGAQVQLEQVGQLGLLRLAEVLGAFEQQPAAALEEGQLALLLEFAGLGGAHLVDHLAELAGDMEAVEHVQGLPGALADHGQVGLPHVGADHPQGRGAVGAEPLEEALEGLDLALLADPQQAAAAGVELVDEGQVAMAGLPGDLVDADGGHAVQADASAAPSHGHGHGAMHGVPGGGEDAGRVLPREALGPAGEEPAEGLGRALLAVGPRHLLDLGRAAARAVHAAPGVDQEGRQAEHRHELEAARLQAVVTGPPAAAGGAHGAPVGARAHVDFQVAVAALRRRRQSP